jgi:hypothetical protein
MSIFGMMPGPGSVLADMKPSLRWDATSGVYTEK